MRRYLKKKTIDWIKLMERSLAAVKKLISENRLELAYNLIVEMQKGAIHIGTQIDETGKDLEVVRELEIFCEEIYLISEKMQMSDSCEGDLLQVEKLLLDIEQKLLKEIPDDKLEVVFLPYKSSMWDSLESIWMAAEQDEECNAYVVPIPYYSRKENFEFDQMFYEGDNYPDYVPVIDYRNIDLEKLHPDIIYFHNPYDGNNYVTSVAPEYYSSKLRNYTELLIYVSYTMSGSYKNLNEAIGAWRGCPGIEYSHKIIMPSEEFKNVLITGGIPEKKLWAMGSPKIDAVIKRNIHKSDEDGVTTILLNTTIANLLRLNLEWFTYINEIIEMFEEDHTLKLIWRPHPLLEDTIKSMRGNMLSQYEELIRKVQTMDNVYIDYREDAYGAFAESDAMISDYSALMMQYIATGKPILNTEEQSSDRENKVVVLDYFSNYFKNDGVSYKMFIDLVKNKGDKKQQERMESLGRMLLNSDGTSGRKIYERSKKEMSFR